MPSTYTLISSNVLGSSAASVTFSAIPSTYTDLVVRASVNQSGGGTQYLYITYNGNTSSVYSNTTLQANGSAASSIRDAASAPTANYGTQIGGTGYDGFNSFELYVPNYGVSQNKPSSIFNAGEDNASSPVWMNASAMLFASTTAISSIAFSLGGGNFVSGSSFYLYGIKNS